MKKTYLVDIISTAVRTIEVEAESPEEAEELVKNMDITLDRDDILGGYDYEVE